MCFSFFSILYIFLPEKDTKLKFIYYQIVYYSVPKLKKITLGLLGNLGHLMPLSCPTYVTQKWRHCLRWRFLNCCSVCTLDQMILGGGVREDWPTHRRMFSSIPVFYLLSVGITPPHSYNNKNFPRHCHTSSGEGGQNFLCSWTIVWSNFIFCKTLNDWTPKILEKYKKLHPNLKITSILKCIYHSTHLN